MRLPLTSAALVCAFALLAACGSQAPAPESPTPPRRGVTVASDAPAEVVAAPGSDSAIYAPNPAEVVVAIDAGHGGCLDWGVPDPSARGVQLAEKTLTLGMAQRLRERLEAQGLGVLMIRDGDEALAGD